MNSDVELTDYRIVSKAAVTSVVFAVLGTLAFVLPVFVVLPLVSLCFGLAAMLTFKKFPGQYTGLTAAKWAAAISGVMLLSAVCMHSYVYATEVPPDYQRISFYELEPKRNSRLLFSEKAAELDGKRVFIKGFVRPGLKRNRLKKFILVGDFGSCCFGGNPKITDVVAISIQNDNYVNYSFRLRRIGGYFKLHRQLKSVHEKDLAHVLYEIEADYVK
jgi:hypothetical protein